MCVHWLLLDQTIQAGTKATEENKREEASLWPNFIGTWRPPCTRSADREPPEVPNLHRSFSPQRISTIIP